MKNLLSTITVTLAMTVAAAAGENACPQPAASGCSPCQSTQWYKAKDGTFRKKMPYAKALDRAEDADDMEIQLKGVQTELATATTTIETVQADAAKQRVWPPTMQQHS